MKPHQILLAFSFIIGLFGYSFWPEFGEDVWFKCQAAMLFGICLSYYLFVRRAEKLTKAMIQVFSWCAFGNMIDEFIFDPTLIQWPEYTFACVGIVSAVMNYQNRKWSDLWQRRRYL